MKLIRLLVLRSFLLRPMRVLLSAFGIIIGVAGILSIGITNRAALDAVTRLFTDASGKASLVVVSAESGSAGFNEKVWLRVGDMPGVAAAVPSLHITTLLAEDASQSELGLNFFGGSVGGLSLYAIDPILDLEARQYRLVAGRFISPELDSNEIVLVDSYAEEKDLSVGGNVEILTENSVERLRLVGLIAKEGPGQSNNGAFGVISLETAQKLFNRPGKLDQIDIVTTPEFTNSAALEQLKTKLQTNLGKDYSVIFPAAQGKQMTQTLGNFQIGLNFLSGMSLFVGAFLIFNSFSMTVVERTRQIGMLRTVGMTRGQVTWQVLVEAIVLGLVSSVAGLVLGIFLADGLSQMMGLLLNQDVSAAQAPLSTIFLGLLVGVVVTMLAALMPAIQAGRITPVEALRIRGTAREGRLLRQGWWGGLALLFISTVILVLNPFPYDAQFRLGSVTVFCLFIGATLIIPALIRPWERFTRRLMEHIYGASGRLGSGNIQRSRLRSTLTVAALMIGVAMIIVVWAMTGSFKGDLDEWLKGYVGGDMYVTSSLPMRRELWNRIRSVEGVAVLTPVRYFGVEWYPPGSEKETAIFMAVEPASYQQVTSFIFSKDQTSPEQAMARFAQGDSVFISSVIAEKFSLTTGDTISLKTKTGWHDFEIAGVVVDYYNQGLVIDGTWTDMERFFRYKDANALMLKLAAGYEVDDVKERIESQYGTRENLAVESNRDLLQRVSRLMQQAFSIFDVLVVIAMLIASLGITNTLTMNVMERIQEIGMLRSVGMTRSQILLMILSEAGSMGILGGTLGLAFGIILARIFMLAMGAMSGYNLDFVLPPGRAVAAVLIALVVSQIAAIVPARKAARIQILEAIHYE